MEQKKISVWLKAVVVGFGICGILFYAVILPKMAGGLVERLPELQRLYLPWLILALLTAPACFGALVLAYIIFDHIGRDQSFVKENVRALTLIAYLAFADTGLLFAGNVIYLILGLSLLPLMELSALLCFIGAAIGAAAYALARLTEKAIELRTENEAYI
ncbi:MAG: DUF2975 domain-containing protein [Eubacteriales bacterium]|nr:DUF2975 domain-containing protein [Eubacteriales bacterium]